MSDITQAEADAIISDLEDGITASEAAIAKIQAILNPPSTGVVWDLIGVANGPTVSNGNRTIAATATHILRSTVLAASGYAEINVDAAGTSGYLALGFINSGQSLGSPPTSIATVPAGAWLRRSDGYSMNNGSYTGPGAGFGTGARISVAWKNGNGWVRVNGTWVQGDPETDSNPMFTGMTGNIGPCVSFMGANGSPVVTSCFNSDQVSGSIPTGCPLLTV
jgi:hypothetical protein